MSLLKWLGLKSGTQKVLLSVPRPSVAGLGIWLWSGPPSSVPAGSVTHSSAPTKAGRSKPEKSSSASGLNSTRTVSSRAVWVLGAFLKARGLLPLLAAIASNRPSCLAAGGKPADCFWSNSVAWASTLGLGVSLEPAPGRRLSPPSRSCLLASSRRGATGL
jgi:hypothetical protein